MRPCEYDNVHLLLTDVLFNANEMFRWDSLTGRKRSSPSTTHTDSSSLPSSFESEPSYSLAPAPQVPDFLNDPTLLHPLSNLSSDSLDYLKLEDSVLSDLPGSKGALPTRGFTDDLCYGTGVTYLAALGTGMDRFGR